MILAVLVLSLKPSFHGELTIPNTPAEKAANLIKEEFAGTSEQSTVNIVFKAPDNRTLESEDVQSKITEVLNEISKDSKVASVQSPIELNNLNEDKTIGYAQVTFALEADKVPEKSKEYILDSIEITRDAGIQTEIMGGDITFSSIQFEGIYEVIGVVVAFIVLAITFGSFIAAGLPILIAVLGLGISLLGIMIGAYFIDLNSISIILAAMLGLAVGIDYSLFIITRFRQELAKGHAINNSISIAIGTSGSAVVFAGLTVIIGLLGLSVAQIPFLTLMGVSAAISILAAVLISIITLPAILGMIGHRLSPAKESRFWQKINGQNRTDEEKANRWGRLVTKHPIIISLVSIAFLAILTIPFFHMNLGLPSDGTAKSTEMTERRAYDLLTEGYGEGFNAQLVVAAKVSKVTEETPQVIGEIVKEISDLKDIKSVSPLIPGPSGEIFMIQITPESGPDDIETKDLVNLIRDKSKETEKEHDIALMVTGSTAMNIDISQQLNDALPLFASLIIGLAYILLVMVFRSLLVPLKAVVGFLLSLGATLGFMVFVVQDGHFINFFGFPSESPILAFLPVITIGILFGLAMDYEIFLVSKMRESYMHTGDSRKAILYGMRDSGRVVTAAALIMMAVFFGFMMNPDAMIKSIGMALPLEYSSMRLLSE
ncbi:MMPL family transporter [Paenibacillus woosongensis]|uniref:MMPL family transporter n=1 Tax=Paenibacillus woosongensis TaxID=307580 RepID=A0AA95L1L1_9BACL|nr:MMPL family transporter [Paenibacillus woosongensis]WHX50049.1 MMPL family transporter [Paenibacillus woosongensis]